MTDSTDYKVLARTYRPHDFTTLIGQDAMVQTLKNAIDSDRLAHAFILTGVRGVGKTTTARILAKGLNCQSFEGPTVEPCGRCDACVAISESRSLDVLEMDAASRTGIDDVREIIESVRYAPQMSRYKVYIIDEVHMLSTQAFNGLLKTLEEPPKHVKFIFATTEIRKLPVTVLSRCQRFDLRRVEAPVMIAHLETILKAEDITYETEALALIARAAEGSVRDALSLLDQAIAHSAGAVSLVQVHDMLGYADRSQILDLFEAVMGGQLDDALNLMKTLYDRGADTVQIIADMLEVCHGITRSKLAVKSSKSDIISDTEQNTFQMLADKLSVPDLTRAWQILLKGLAEVRGAPKPQMAADMLLIRLAHAARLPDPAALVKKLENKLVTSASQTGTSSRPASNTGASNYNTDYTQVRSDSKGPAQSSILPFKGPEVIKPADPTPDYYPISQSFHMPQTFKEMVDLFYDHKEVVIATLLRNRVRLIHYRPGAVEMEVKKGPVTLLPDMKRFLKKWTGENWTLTLSSEGGGATLDEQVSLEQADLMEKAKHDPSVKKVLEIFPDARIRKITPYSVFEAPVLGAESHSDGGSPHLYGPNGDETDRQDGAKNEEAESPSSRFNIL